MVICDFLEKNARLFPSETALVEINPSEERDEAETWRDLSLLGETSADTPYRRDITWGQFDEKANRFANLLLSRGLKKNQKVGILMMNCLEWLPIYFGVLKSGGIAVPMNFRYSSDEIDYCLDLADVEFFVFGPEFVERIQPILGKLSKVKQFFFVGKDGPDFADNYDEMVRYCSKTAPPVLNREDDLAAIYFSSGTTGFPKAILHNHKALVQSCVMEQKHHGQQKNDTFLLLPPLYHTGAKMHWFGSLISASKAVILRGVKPEWILRAITEEKCTIVWLLVPWCQDLLQSIESGKINLDEYLLDQWRLMHIGAQPVPHSLIQRWMKIFPHHQYDTNYGLSECLGPGCVHLGVDNIDHVGAIGVPGYNWETKIVDENGNQVKDGEVGELCVKGDGVMLEYYKNPEATKESVRDGWLYTGDMAKMTDGFIYLVDRKKDVVISGGENIYPVQIEDFLHTMPKIKDVAVIGLPDERLGEITAAIIEIKDGETCTKEEINAFCEDLPRYKRPKQIIFADIPRNPTGKIEKPLLRKRYSSTNLVEAQTMA